MTTLLIISPDGTLTGSSPLPDLWRKDGDSLDGRHFCDLFRHEVVPETEEDKAIQWEFLRESARSSPLQLEIEGSDSEAIPVTVTLQEIPGGGVVASVVAHVEGQAEDAADVSSGRDESPAPESHVAHLPGDLDKAGHIGFFDLRLKDGIFWYSAAWKRMLGYEPHELADSHETFIKLVHPEDSEATPDHRASGPPLESVDFSVEFRMRHRLGEYRWVQSVGTQSYDEAGELARVAGFHLDIQERKEIEEESLQHEERFLTLVHRGKLGFFDLDFRNRTAFFSPAWQKMLGYDDGDLKNMPDTFKRLLHSEAGGADDLAIIFTDTIAGQTSFVRELRMQRKDGEYVNLHTQIVRLTDRRGTLTRVLGFQTGLHDAPPVLWNGPPPEALFEGLQEANEGIVLTGADSAVIFFNKKAEALTGFDSEEVIGRTLPEALRLLYAYNREPAQNLADEVLSSGNQIRFSADYLLEQSGREPRKIVISCIPLRDSRERILGTVLVFRDPMEMSLTPEELVKSNRMEALGLLAGCVAHDFNNLLTSIVGGISLARETCEWEPLDSSERACLSAKNLTRQLLTFARGREAPKKPHHISNLINDCVRLASSGSKVKPEVRLSPDLHPVLIDPARMTQVFQNLVINAIQAMGETGGDVVIEGQNIVLEDGEIMGLAAGTYVRVSVKDTGCGIPSEDLMRIFHPFFTTKKSGTGLGLSTVASIVREHEGQITVTSKTGVGSTFFVHLPMSEEPVEVEDRKVPALKFGTGRILFMDDDEEISALAGAMLKRLEYQYDLARNGEEALALYQRYLKVGRPYDAVVLDLTIVGGIGGEETFKALKELNPQVRAIVSSGYSTDDLRDHYLNQGFSGVLAKPYRSEEMGKLLRQVLGKDSP